MEPAAVGTPIVVIGNQNRHSYTIGQTYTVSAVDPSDGTFRARDGHGKEGNWLRWSDVAPARASDWTRIAEMLPDEIVAFLSAFDGISAIRLNHAIVDEVLNHLPDIQERIVAATQTADGRAAIEANRPHPSRRT